MRDRCENEANNNRECISICEQNFAHQSPNLEVCWVNKTPCIALRKKRATDEDVANGCDPNIIIKLKIIVTRKVRREVLK